MHSSRMRTARLLPVSPSMHCSRWCTCLGDTCPEGTCPGGVVPTWGVYLPRGCTCPVGCTNPEGCTCQWGVIAQLVYLPMGCVPAWGLYLPGGVPAQGVEVSDQVLPVNRMTDKCKNITLPQTSFAGGNKGFLLDNLKFVILNEDHRKV